MAKRSVEVVIKATDQASQELKNLGNTLKAIGAAAFAKEVADVAIELATLGAAAERTERGFTAISGGSATAAANLDAMITATNGAIDRTTAMGLASQMMQMGIADNADALARNAEMATRLGAAMGTDAITAMENWNAMLANQSLPRLDTYGISSGKVRERINELMAATEGLTREQAFNQAVMEEGAKAMERLGDAVEDDALAVEQAKAAWTDFKTEIGRTLAPLLGSIAGGLAKVTRELGDQQRAVNTLEKAYGKAAVSQAHYNSMRGIEGETLESLQERYERDLAAIEKGTAAIDQGFSDVGTSSAGAMRGIGAVGDSAAEASAPVEDFSDAVQGLTRLMDTRLSDEFERFAEKTGELDQEAADLKATIAGLEGQRWLSSTQIQELEDAKTALADNQQAVMDLAAAHEEATGRIVFGFAQQEAAADGVITQQEYDVLAELGQAYGLFDETAATALRNVKSTMDGVRSGAISARDAVGLLKGSIDALEDKDITVRVRTEGQLPGTGRAVGTPGTTTSEDRAGMLQAQGGDYMVNRPTMFIAGEAGAERALFIPQGRPGFDGAVASQAMGAGNGTSIGTLQLNVYGTADARETANLVMYEFQARGLMPQNQMR